MDEGHEPFHELIVEGPFLQPIPKIVFGNQFDEVLLVEPIEFQDVEIGSRHADPLVVKFCDDLL